jgi:hypothetical protein
MTREQQRCWYDWQSTIRSGCGAGKVQSLQDLGRPGQLKEQDEQYDEN